MFNHRVMECGRIEKKRRTTITRASCADRSLELGLFSLSILAVRHVKNSSYLRDVWQCTLHTPAEDERHARTTSRLERKIWMWKKSNWCAFICMKSWLEESWNFFLLWTWKHTAVKKRRDKEELSSHLNFIETFQEFSLALQRHSTPWTA